MKLKIQTLRMWSNKAINREEFIINFFTELVLPVGNHSLKRILLTHFTNKINITALDMKYFRQSTEQGRLKLSDSSMAKLKWCVSHSKSLLIH